MSWSAEIEERINRFGLCLLVHEMTSVLTTQRPGWRIASGKTHIEISIDLV